MHDFHARTRLDQVLSWFRPRTDRPGSCWRDDATEAGTSSVTPLPSALGLPLPVERGEAKGIPASSPGLALFTQRTNISGHRNARMLQRTSRLLRSRMSWPRSHPLGRLRDHPTTITSRASAIGSVSALLVSASSEARCLLGASALIRRCYDCSHAVAVAIVGLAR